MGVFPLHILRTPPHLQLVYVAHTTYISDIAHELSLLSFISWQKASLGGWLTDGELPPMSMSCTLPPMQYVSKTTETLCLQYFSTWLRLQILDDFPTDMAAKIIEAAGAPLDTCFELLPARFHPAALRAICSTESSGSQLDIDGSPQQWSQRCTARRLGVTGLDVQHHPRVCSRTLVALFEATATLTALEGLRISLTVGLESDPVTKEVASAFNNALTALTALRSLEVLASLASAAVRAVSSSLPHLSHLENLAIVDGQLSSDHVTTLCKQLKHLPHLRRLNLSDSHLVLRTPKAAATLTASFSALKNLQDLNITGFRSFGKSKKAVSALSALTSLTRLDIESIGLVPGTVPSLAEAIRCMPGLQHVAMSYNQLGKVVNGVPRASEVPESVKPLCKALIGRKELLTVDLSCTHLGYVSSTVA